MTQEQVIKIEDILKEDEEITIIKNDLYAKDNHTKEKREINNLGCDLIVAFNNKIKTNIEEIKELEKKIDILREYNRNLHYDKGILFKNGFCDKSERAYKRDKLTNQIIGEYRTHLKNCRNKGDE